MATKFRTALLCLFLLVPSIAQAACDPAVVSTTSSRLGLTVPGTDQCNWHVPSHNFINQVDLRMCAVDYANTFSVLQTFSGGIRIPTGAGVNYCWVAVDGTGVGTWKPCPSAVGAGTGDVKANDTSTAVNELTTYADTTGKRIKGTEVTSLCVGPDNPWDCCTGVQTGSCIPGLDANGRLVGMTLDSPARLNTAGCVYLKEASANAPSGGSPNVISLCGASNVTADRIKSFLASGNVSAAAVEDPSGNTNKCARFVLDGDGNATLAAGSEDCLTQSQAVLPFNPRIQSEFFDDFLVGYVGASSTNNGTIGFGWSVIGNNLSGSGCATTYGDAVTNHPGIFRVLTSGASGVACILKNTTGTIAIWPVDLMSRTTWSMEWNGTRATTSNQMWAMGLAPGSQSIWSTNFPDKFAGIVLRDTTSTGPGYCTGNQDPFPCCTGASTGNCTDSTYKCVACDTADATCTEVDTGVTPSAVTVWDKFRVKMTAPLTLQCGVAAGDGNQTFTTVTVNTDVPPSMTPKFAFVVTGHEAVAKEARIDYFYYTDSGIAR